MPDYWGIPSFQNSKNRKNRNLQNTYFAEDSVNVNRQLVTFNFNTKFPKFVNQFDFISIIRELACVSLKPKSQIAQHYINKYNMNVTGATLSLEVPEILDLINLYDHD